MRQILCLRGMKLYSSVTANDKAYAVKLGFTAGFILNFALGYTLIAIRSSIECDKKRKRRVMHKN